MTWKKFSSALNSELSRLPVQAVFDSVSYVPRADFVTAGEATGFLSGASSEWLWQALASYKGNRDEDHRGDEAGEAERRADRGFAGENWAVLRQPELRDFDLRNAGRDLGQDQRMVTVLYGPVAGKRQVAYGYPAYQPGNVGDNKDG